LSNFFIGGAFSCLAPVPAARQPEGSKGEAKKRHALHPNPHPPFQFPSKQTTPFMVEEMQSAQVTVTDQQRSQLVSVPADIAVTCGVDVPAGPQTQQPVSHVQSPD
jgi:hypothetical protein